MGVIVLHVPTAELARCTTADITIEAEYGSFVWLGTRFTAAHHQKSGPYAGSHIVEGGQPSPCNNPNIPNIEDGHIGVSHFDLDTLGGCLRAMGTTGFFGGRFDSFWDLAEFVDVYGPHKLARAGASDHDIDRLHAWWAWSQENRVSWSRDEVADITGFVMRSADALRRILTDDDGLVQAGIQWRAEQAKLNADSFVEARSGVIVRVAPTFVNHLYAVPGGTPMACVVALNPTLGAVTVSFADASEGVSARDIVQSLWGPEAGGHDGIAGSPRGQRMTLTDLEAAIRAAVKMIR